jgi:hypothetical protein
MRINESKLKQIIREEARRVLRERWDGPHGTVEDIAKKLERKGFEDEADKIRNHTHLRDDLQQDLEINVQGTGDVSLRNKDNNVVYVIRKENGGSIFP